MNVMSIPQSLPLSARIAWKMISPQILQSAAHKQEEARLATLRALEDSCVAGDLAAVRAVVSAMDPSAATALVNHAASGRNTLLFKVFAEHM